LILNETDVPGSSTATSSGPGGIAARKQRVDAFLAQCNARSARAPINRKHIWRCVGHKNARQFEYWQRNDPKATAADDKNFSRILQTEPAAFILQLKDRRLL
jgi:hypothetical protein